MRWYHHNDSNETARKSLKLSKTWFIKIPLCEKWHRKVHMWLPCETFTDSPGPHKGQSSFGRRGAKSSWDGAANKDTSGAQARLSLEAKVVEHKHFLSIHSDKMPVAGLLAQSHSWRWSQQNDSEECQNVHFGTTADQIWCKVFKQMSFTPVQLQRTFSILWPLQEKIQQKAPPIARHPFNAHRQRFNQNLENFGFDCKGVRGLSLTAKATKTQSSAVQLASLQWDACPLEGTLYSSWTTAKLVKENQGNCVSWTEPSGPSVHTVHVGTHCSVTQCYSPWVCWQLEPWWFQQSQGKESWGLKFRNVMPVQSLWQKVTLIDKMVNRFLYVSTKAALGRRHYSSC